MLENSPSLAWGIFFLSLLLSAFFTSSEVTFLTLNRSKVKYLAAQGVPWARKAAGLIDPPDRLLASVILGNNLVQTLAAVVGTIVVVDLLGESWGVPVATLGIAALTLVLGEVTPKLLATRYSERLAWLYVRPLEIVIIIFAPFANLVAWVSSLLSRMARGPKASRAFLAEDEIRLLISAGAHEGLLHQDEAHMLHRVFRFWDKQVREVMVPRNNITWVEKGTTLSQFLETYAASRHSRFPVYDGAVDNVVGVLSIKEVLLAQSRGAVQPNSVVTDMVWPPYFTPASKPIGHLLAEMRQAHHTMAIVVDEHGGTAGIADIQLLAGEIVGEMGDELAQPAKDYEVINEHTYILNGAMNIGDANEELQLQLPSGPYETVAGLVLSRLGHIPRNGESFALDSLKLVVAEMKGVRVSKVLVSRRRS